MCNVILNIASNQHKTSTTHCKTLQNGSFPGKLMSWNILMVFYFLWGLLLNFNGSWWYVKVSLCLLTTHIYAYMFIYVEWIILVCLCKEFRQPLCISYSEHFSASSSISENPKDVQCQRAQKAEGILCNNLICPFVFSYYYVSFSSKIPSLASIVNDKNMIGKVQSFISPFLESPLKSLFSFFILQNHHSLL